MFYPATKENPGKMSSINFLLLFLFVVIVGLIFFIHYPSSQNNSVQVSSNWVTVSLASIHSFPDIDANYGCSLYGDKISPQSCHGYQCYIGYCQCPTYDPINNPDCSKDPSRDEYMNNKLSICPTLASALPSGGGKMHDLTNYDFCYHYLPTQGLITSDFVRWKKAQTDELSIWQGFPVNYDRDADHEEMFNNYAILAGKDMGDLLEVGAGPYTQTKSVLAKTRGTVKTLTLAEPQLISYYTTVSTCTYKSGYLQGFEAIPIQFVQAGGEQLRWRDSYDTVIMINVLEHVLDGYEVMQNLFNAVKPGGILIFHERFYDRKLDKVFEATKNNVPIAQRPYFWDHLHPVGARKKIYDIMFEYFDILYEKLYHYEGKYPTDEGGYWIAKKKTSVQLPMKKIPTIIKQQAKLIAPNS